MVMCLVKWSNINLAIKETAFYEYTFRYQM